jgi:GTP-binding protein
MKGIINATFVGGTVNPLARRGNPLPEVIFLGRSNVGKSSVINCLLNQKKLARTSSTPGKTRQFFFYQVEERLLFVDPPGYGYAHVAQIERTRWIRELDRYLRKAEMLLGVVLVMDMRHAPLPIDLEMAQWLAESKISAVYALNKSDKLTRSKRADALARARRELTFADSGAITPFSAQTREGRDVVWQIIESWLQKSS